MKKTDNFKKRLSEKEREDKALAAHNQVLKLKEKVIFDRFLYLISIRVIWVNEYWKEMSCESFEMYCCQPDIDIGLIPSTIKKYVKIIDDLLLKGLEESDMKELTINKLDIMRNAREPSKWVEPAKNLGYTDLKKEIREKEKGIKPVDDVDKAIKKENNPTLEYCKHMRDGKCLRERV